MSFSKIVLISIAQSFLLSSFAFGLETPKSLDEIENVEMVFQESLGVYKCPAGYTAIQNTNLMAKCVPNIPYEFMPYVTPRVIETPEQCYQAYKEEEIAWVGTIGIFGGLLGGPMMASGEPVTMTLGLLIASWTAYKAKTSGSFMMEDLVEDELKGTKAKKLSTLRHLIRKERGHDIPESDLGAFLALSLENLDLCPQKHSDERLAQKIEKASDELHRQYEEGLLTKGMTQRGLFELSLRVDKWKSYRDPIYDIDHMMDVLLDSMGLEPSMQQ